MGHVWAFETIQAPLEAGKVRLVEAADPSYEADWAVAVLQRAAAAASVACTVAVVLRD